jgi:tRNA-dihydrouridine synthase A
MMDRTDRHCRFFHRLLCRRALLYTEMVTTGAILRGDRSRALAFSEAERPLALQLGGDDPAALAECARIAEAEGYDEVNLNVGCPSPRVQGGQFGAVLMHRPDRVAAAVEAMKSRAGIPITVKHRIGVDDRDRFEDLVGFVETVAGAGCDAFAVHARKALLSGLSPRQNREIPPLRYEDVYRLKETFPHLQIELNGGVETLDEARDHLARVDGVMLGRAAYHDPFVLAAADDGVFGDPDAEEVSRREIVLRLLPYVETHLQSGGRLHQISHHLLGLFHRQPGSRRWKRHLSEHAHRPAAGVEVLIAALELVSPES